MGISDFYAAVHYVRALPYGKNLQNKIIDVLEEGKGNNSTKNALLVHLANENGISDIKLAIGFYDLNAKLAPILNPILETKQLDKFPFVANYILHNNLKYDFSGLGEIMQVPFDHLKNELVILPNQINDFVIHFHKFYLINWIKENNLNYKTNVDDLWLTKKHLEDKIYNSFSKLNINKTDVMKHSLLKLYGN